MSQFPDDLPAEPGQQHLRRALRELPAHEPDDALWLRIGAQLDTDAAVSRALPDLPEHEPDDDLWAVIVGRLDHEAPAPLALNPADEAPVHPLHLAPAALADEAAAGPRPSQEPPAAPAPTVLEPAALTPPHTTRRWLNQPWHWAASVAAATVLMLVGAWWQHQQRPTGPVVARVSSSAPEPMAAPAARETISYGEEVLPADKAATARFASSSFDPLQAQGVAFIDAHCTSLPTVCQSAQFQQLRTELAELEAEEQRLQQAAKRFGSSPELEQNRARVTTQKATITRELIQLLIS